MGINRSKSSKSIFAKLADYVDSANSFYKYNLDKCYIDFQKEDKETLDTIREINVQKFIPNAKFAIVSYRNRDMLIVVGEQTSEHDGSVLLNVNVDLAIFVYAICNLQGNVNYAIPPMRIYNEILCQPEDENYHGHQLEDLQEVFENVSAYEIVEESSLIKNDVYDVYAYHFLKLEREKIGRWDKKTLDLFEDIIFSGNDKIPYHNIVMSMLANQWNHSFLETYRCIERLFSVIRLEAFYDVLGTELTLLAVAKEIEEKISWRPNEETAIQEIFKNIDTTAIENVKNSYKQVKGMGVAKWYYKEIRNPIAHYRAVHSPLDLKEKEWNILLQFNLSVIEYLYRKYRGKI